MKPPVKDLPKGDAGLGLGPLAQLNDPPRRGMEIAGVGLSLVWVLLILVYVLVTPPGSETRTLGLVMTLLMVFLPIALIWAVVITLRSIRELRAEAARLQATVDAMRSSYVQAQGNGMKSSVERKIDEIAASTKQAETVLATFTSRRDTSLTVPSADRKAALVSPRAEPMAEEPTLALGTPAEDFRPPLLVADFIRALQFPETPEDKEGFRALRLALEDRTSSKLIRAAQDVLTLLSQDGIYMDDLQPDLCHPELWRRFSGGERGRSIAALGGIRDRTSLALTASRMKTDPVFRDAAHHFLRTFDKTFAAFEPNATDAELADLADTRTARAFMLFGRVTGTFD
ncbi:MAG: hypothetical protein U1E69_00885 [Tabrizicola sp.]|uniref:hypothetical protein n=1 Tax=Tabrizicola sp. TaxID=2005166 RepID=UPI002AB9203E|nr:hypothetical protein [Tabrizicola sp.]MDZ4085337.1 hypothetical protein [Tabrizicola sp.]